MSPPPSESGLGMGLTDRLAGTHVPPPAPDVVIHQHAHDSVGILFPHHQEKGDDDVMQALVVVQFRVLHQQSEDHTS